MDHFLRFILLIWILVELVNVECQSTGSFTDWHRTNASNKITHNPCAAGNDSMPKMWGVDCMTPCNCKANIQCSYLKGVCPGDCAIEWTRESVLSPCSFRKLTHRHTRDPNNATPPWSGQGHFPINFTWPFKADVIKGYKGVGEFLRKYEHPLREKHIPSYTSAARVVCRQERSKREVYVSLTIQPPTSFVIHLIDVTFFFGQIVKNDTIVAEILLTGDPGERVFRTIKKKKDTVDCTFHAKFMPPVLMTKIKIYFRDKDHLLSCPYRHASGMVSLYGFPLCPYRRWGMKCEFFCNCPCEFAECNPQTGSCTNPLNYCGPEKYGQSCEKQCSDKCLSSTYFDEADGKVSEHIYCNAASGFCEACPRQDIVGRHCESIMERAQYDAFTEFCSNVTSLGPEMGLYASKKPRDEGVFSNLRRGEVALIFLCTIAFIFIAIFCVYLVCVKLIARRKIRIYLERVERQRSMRTSIRSWSELKDEFKTSYAPDGTLRRSLAPIFFHGWSSPKEVPPRQAVENLTPKDSSVDPLGNKRVSFR